MPHPKTWAWAGIPVVCFLAATAWAEPAHVPKGAKGGLAPRAGTPPSSVVGRIHRPRGTSDCEFSADGKQLFTTDNATPNLMTAWDAKTLEPRFTVPLGDDERDSGYGSIRVSPDGTQLLAVSWPGAPVLVDASTGEILKTAPLPPNTEKRGYGIGFSQQGAPLVVTTENDTFFKTGVYDLQSGIRLYSAFHVSGSSIGDDGRFLVSYGGPGQDARLFGFYRLPGKMGVSLQGDLDTVGGHAITRDGRVAAILERNGRLTIADPLTGKILSRQQIHDEKAPRRSRGVSFSRDGRTLAIWDTESEDSEPPRLLDVASGLTVSLPRTGSPAATSCFAFSPDGRRVARGTELGIEILDLSAALTGPPAVKELSTGRRPALLGELGKSPLEAFAAMKALFPADGETVSLLASELAKRAYTPPPESDVKALIKGLGADKFANREVASRELRWLAQRERERIGEAGPVQKALEDAGRGRGNEIGERTRLALTFARTETSPEGWHDVRAVQLLARTATPEAIAALTRLSRQGEGVVARAAREALRNR